jgi:hypothetical protein
LPCFLVKFEIDEDCFLYSILNRNYQSKMRSKETIEASGAYERPEYEPTPSHCKYLFY